MWARAHWVAGLPFIEACSARPGSARVGSAGALSRLGAQSFLAVLAFLLHGCLERKRSDAFVGTSATASSAVTSPSAVSSAITGASAETARPIDSPCPDHTDGAVRVVDPTHCQVSRALFFDAQNCLLAEPRIVQVTSQGRVIGIRNDSLGARSVYARCGIRSSDVWTAVNGHSLANAEDVLAAYTALRQSQQLNIELLRSNRPLTVRLTLTDD